MGRHQETLPEGEHSQLMANPAQPWPSAGEARPLMLMNRQRVKCPKCLGVFKANGYPRHRAKFAELDARIRGRA